MKYLIALSALLASANVMAAGAAPINPDADSVHRTAAGEIYVSDSSFSVLGNAYRDPRGLVWGKVVRDINEGILKVGEAEAEKDCLDLNETSDIEIRLPTNEEFKNLRADLGSAPGIESNYSPYVQSMNMLHLMPIIPSPKVMVLPDLAGNYFWSSTVNEEDTALLTGTDAEGGEKIGKVGYVFSGDNLDFNGRRALENPISQVQLLPAAFRCVAKHK